MPEDVRRWTAVALALRRPSDDNLRSRLSTYLHPLAGRSLAWHALKAISKAAARPPQLLLVSADPSLAGVLDELRVETIFPARGTGWAVRVSETLHPASDRVLVADAAAAGLGASLRALTDGEPRRALLGASGEPVAVWLERDWFIERARDAPDLARLASECEPTGDDSAADVFVVRDRASLARAARLIRGRVVAGLMRAGVTFVLPESVSIDVDVEIGPDTVIYPGVILEGHTSIGEGSVIGPACRIVDSQLGSGVELRGWNYVVNTTIRNRAVLEPYVRRGYD